MIIIIVPRLVRRIENSGITCAPEISTTFESANNGIIKALSMSFEI
jgi:hypothetical protein